MRERRLAELRRRLPRNNQRGFTLIELLVVISILGILAAVVTMSMVGITNVAQDRAKKTELQQVQVAYDTMLADQGVTDQGACAGAPAADGAATNNMDGFPATAKPFDTQGGRLTQQHRIFALYPAYLRQKMTTWEYYCTSNGEIKQKGS